jgi:PadR family transcriptional regulator, regulatory protein PadR
VPVDSLGSLGLDQARTLARHPILARLETVNWVESRWEDIDPSIEGRPARRYYRLTTEGAEQAQRALARAYRPRRAAASRPVLGQS